MSTMSKAAAAVLVAGLVGILSGKVTDGVYYGADGSATVKRGFSIEVNEASAEGAAAPAAAAPADINTLLASADVKAGADIFSKKCTTCHNSEKGAANKIGPHLWGVVNRKVASVGDFKYSAAMKGNASKSWSFDELNQFLTAPQKHVKGTLMSFPGLPKDQDRANVIAYLNSQSDSPAKLPAAKK